MRKLRRRGQGSCDTASVPCAAGALAEFREFKPGEVESSTWKQRHLGVAGFEPEQVVTVMDKYDTEVDVTEPPRASRFPFRGRVS